MACNCNKNKGVITPKNITSKNITAPVVATVPVDAPKSPEEAIREKDILVPDDVQK